MPGTREHRIYSYMKMINYLNPEDADVDYYELYDLKNDPHELDNIYGKKGMEKIVKSLKETLDNYRRNLKVDEY